MALDPDLVALMIEPIVIQPVASRAITGSVTYGDPIELLGKTDWKTMAIESASGRTIVGRGTVYLNQYVDVDTESLLTLPDGSQPPLLGVQHWYDETGQPAYTQLVFQ